MVNKPSKKHTYQYQQPQDRLEPDKKLDIKSFNYKNYQSLSSTYLTPIHTIKSSSITMLNRRMQKKLANAISHARFLGLISTRGNKV